MRKAYLWIRKIFLILALLLGLLWAGKLVFEAHFLILNGELYSLHRTELDVSGQTLEEPEALAAFRRLERLDLRGTGVSLGQVQWLQKRLPDCEILWEILFQDVYYSPETEELTLSSLSLGEVAVLDFLPELRYVDARDCRDYGALTELERHHPGCVVDFTVALGGENWPREAEALVLRDASGTDLEQCLPYLPLARCVHLKGTLPGVEELEALKQNFPAVDFSWTVELGGGEFAGDSAELVLTGTALDSPETLEQALPYFPGLRSLDLRGTALDNGIGRAMSTAHPELSVQWDVKLGDLTVSADAEEVDLTGLPLESTEDVLRAAGYFRNLKKIVICDSGFSNEELDELNRELGEIRVVWNLDLAGYSLRTDAVYYAPNKYGTAVSDEILEPLRYCTDLQCVDIGHSSATHCQWAASMPQLRYLILADTPVQDLTPLKDLKNLVFLELFQTPVRDYSPLLGCTGLEDLNLCYSYGDPAPILEMTWLRRLWWDGGRLSAAALRKHLPETQVECNSHSSTGAGWREGKHYYDMRDLIGMDYMVG